MSELSGKMLCMLAVCIASMATDINLSHTVTSKNINHSRARSFLTIDFLLEMEEAIFTLGSIIILEKKDKIKPLPIFVYLMFGKHFGFIFVPTP